jgi:ATP synthase I chain
MSHADDRLYTRAVERMLRVMAWLGAAGVVAACLGWGWRAGLGYGMGAAASWATFRWLRHFVEALGGQPARLRILVLAALRYLLLGAGLYVIFKFSKISLMAALAGLFVSTAAAIAEGVFELLHGERTLDHHDLQ